MKRNHEFSCKLENDLFFFCENVHRILPLLSWEGAQHGRGGNLFAKHVHLIHLKNNSVIVWVWDMDFVR